MAQLLRLHTGPIEDPSLVQFPAPLSDSLQLFVITTAGDTNSFSGLHGHMHTHRHACTELKIYSKNECSGLCCNQTDENVINVSWIKNNLQKTGIYIKAMVPRLPSNSWIQVICLSLPPRSQDWRYCAAYDSLQVCEGQQVSFESWFSSSSPPLEI